MVVPDLCSDAADDGDGDEFPDEVDVNVEDAFKPLTNAAPGNPVTLQSAAIKQLRDLEAARRAAESKKKEEEEERKRKLEEEAKAKIEEEKRKQFELKRQKEIEERKVAEEAERARKVRDEKKKQEEAEINTMKTGIVFTKIPRGAGAPRQCRIYITNALEGAHWSIGWDSKKKKEEETEWDVKTCDLKLGHTGGQFLTNKKLRDKFPAHHCLSVAGPSRGLDLVALNDKDFQIAFNVLTQLPFASKSGLGLSAGSVSSTHQHQDSAAAANSNHGFHTADTP